MPLAVLIVDDHEGFRQTARALLEAGGFEVVGEAADGKSGIVETERLRPELILLDTNAAPAANHASAGPGSSPSASRT